MLSRVADSLYWMSRYLERAEHTARLLDVNLHGLLDQKSDVIEQRWGRVRRSLHVPARPVEPADAQAIAYALAFDQSLSGSIISCISTARLNAREVREQISTEMWSQLNRLYLHVQHTNQKDFWEGQAHTLFQEVKEGAHLFQGITDTTLSHEEGWFFIQLGRYLERVLATVTLLDVHLSDYSLADEQDLYVDWLGLLKSCTAFEAYCRVHTAIIRPDKVVAFLLLHADFPHSVRFGVGMVSKSLSALSESIPALKQSEASRLAGKLLSTLRFESIEEIMAHDVHVHLSAIRERCIQIHQAVYDSCITYPIDLVLAA